jgi:hypothetical protein
MHNPSLYVSDSWCQLCDIHLSYFIASHKAGSVGSCIGKVGRKEGGCCMAVHLHLGSPLASLVVCYTATTLVPMEEASGGWSDHPLH